MPCVIVQGVVKNLRYQLGEPESNKTLPSSWNAVYVNGSWRIVDVFNASEYVSLKWGRLNVAGEMIYESDRDDFAFITDQVNEFYFIPDPDSIITTHFPDEPDWQLLEEPLTLEEFEKRVHIGWQFFAMRMALCDKSERNLVVEPKTGEIDLVFSLDDTTEDTHPLYFSFQMFKQNEPGEAVSSIGMARYVFLQKKADVIQFRCQFPQTGRYKLLVYGNSDGTSNEFYLCFSYIFDVAVAKHDAKPLPSTPTSGWGPGADAKAAGLIPLSHHEPVIETDDGQVQLQFRMQQPLDIELQLLSEAMHELLLNKHTAMTIDDDLVTVDIRLPVAGEYAFSLFVIQKDHMGVMRSVCNYLICSKTDNSNLELFHNRPRRLGASPNAAAEGISAISHPDGVIQTDTGKFSVTFAHGCDYEVSVLVDNHEMDRESLANCANVTNRDDDTSSSIDITLPSPGDYDMIIYAKKNDSDRMFLVHSYHVTSTQSEKTQIAPRVDDLPEGVYTTCSETSFTVHVPRRENPVVSTLRECFVREKIAHDQVKVTKTHDEDVITSSSLTDKSKYELFVFEHKPNGALLTVCTCRLIHVWRAPMPDEAHQEHQAATVEKVRVGFGNFKVCHKLK